MAVDINIPITELEEASEQTSRTYNLDINGGRIVGMVDGVEAVNQAIRKAIITMRFCNLIYDDDYGSEIGNIISDKTATPELMETVIPELVKEALSQDTRILDVHDFDISFNNDEVSIYFEVDTIFGTTTVNEVF